MVPSLQRDVFIRRLTHALQTIAAAVLALSFSAPALGDDSPAGKKEEGSYTVLVLPYASIHGMLPAQVGEKTTQFLRTEIRGTEGVKLVKVKRSSGVSVTNPTPPIDQTKLNRAKQNSAEAKAALEMGEFTTAISNYHKAIDVEREQHPHIDFDELRNQYIGLAVASFQLGEEDEGQRYLETAARLDTSKSVDAASMPPVFVRAYQQAVKRIKNQPTSTINVDCTVPDSEVYLNGKKIGSVPLNRSDLPPGTHYLKVVPPKGSTIWAQSVDLVSGQVTRVNARIDLIGGALDDIDRELSENRVSPLAADRAVELAQESAATHVILGGVHQAKDGIAMSSFLISVREKTVCPLEDALFDEAMMGAGIELYKVGADIMRKLKTCDKPRKLPTPVAPNAPSRSAQAASVRPEALAVYQSYSHSPSASHRLGGDISDAPRAVRLEAPLTAAALGDEPGSGKPWKAEGSGEKIDENKRGLTWLWITLGVVAAAGAAVGGYFIYDVNSNPAAKGTVSWAI